MIGYKRFTAFTMIAIASLLALSSVALAEERAAVIFTGGDVYLKSGPARATWNQITSGVNVGSLSLAKDYIGLIDAGGGNPNTLNIKDPYWNSQWNFVHLHTASKASITQTSDGLYRIAVLQTDGSVVLKDGVWNSGYWSGTLESSGVVSVKAAGDRVAVLMSNGDLKVKELNPSTISHPNNVPWLLQATNVAAFDMTANRIAYVNASKQVYAKEGSANAPWYGNKTLIYSSSDKIRLGGDRLCVIKQNSSVECKQGGLNAPSVYTYDSANDFQVSTSRFIVRAANNDAKIMEGTLYGNPLGWQTITFGNAQAIELNQLP